MTVPAATAPTPTGIPDTFMPTLIARWSSLSPEHQERIFAQMSEEQMMELLTRILPA